MSYSIRTNTLTAIQFIHIFIRTITIVKTTIINITYHYNKKDGKKPSFFM